MSKLELLEKLINSKELKRVMELLKIRDKAKNKKWYLEEYYEYAGLIKELVKMMEE